MSCLQEHLSLNPACYLHDFNLNLYSGRTVLVKGYGDGPCKCSRCGGGLELAPEQEGNWNMVNTIVLMWSELVIDLRDRDDPENAEPERFELCEECAAEWEEALGEVVS